MCDKALIKSRVASKILRNSSEILLTLHYLAVKAFRNDLYYLS